MSIEDTVKRILQQSVINNNSIEPHLAAAKAISDQRGVDYGFEWIIHTTIAKYVIDHAVDLNISEIRVNKKDPSSNKIPDLAFKLNQTSTYLEFKTFSGNSYSYIKNDLNKLRQMTGNRFIVACGYRTHNESVPNWNNVTILDPLIINSDFRLVVIKVV